MPTDTLEPPTQTDSAPDMAQAVFNPQPDSGGSKAASTTQTVPDAASSTQELIDKPDAMRGAGEKPTKKSALDKIGAVKKPDAAPAEPAKPDDTPAPERVFKEPKELREAYNQSQKELKELQAKVPEYEKTAGEYTATKEELAKMKAMNLNPQEREQFMKLQQLNAESVLLDSDSFKKEIDAPMKAQFDRIKGIAERAKMNPVQFSALQDAIDIPDEFDRAEAIRGIIEGVEDIDPRMVDRYCAAAESAANELTKNIYPKREQKLAEAREIQQAARIKEKDSDVAATQAKQQEFQKEHEFVSKALSEGAFKVLMDDSDLSVEGVTLAEAMKSVENADNPRDLAYNATAGATMPFLVVALNKALARAHAAEESMKARNGAAPGRSDAVSKVNGNGEKLLTAEEVFGARRI